MLLVECYPVVRAHIATLSKLAGGDFHALEKAHLAHTNLALEKLQLHGTVWNVVKPDTPARGKLNLDLRLGAECGHFDGGGEEVSECVIEFHVFLFWLSATVLRVRVKREIVKSEQAKP